eukprot:SAG25_NODE_620_length_6411_cov_11.541350_3_plen_219_part_00
MIRALDWLRFAYLRFEIPMLICVRRCRYHSKVMFLVQQMQIMRSKGLALNRSSAAYGMPVGNDLDDTTGVSITCGTTYYQKGDLHTEGRARDCTATYPFVSIAAEMERAFRDLGAVWQKMGRRYARPDIAANGTVLLEAAEALHVDLLNSMKASQLVDPTTHMTCNPYIAGFGSCQVSPGTCVCPEQRGYACMLRPPLPLGVFLALRFLNLARQIFIF